MDSAVKSELNSCIQELRAIARELENAASEVTRSINGMNTRKYTSTLYECAKKYKKAADKLSRIE